MTERQLIADLLSALEYHTEQTRPIEFSKVAIQAAREYLQKPEQPTQRTWVGLTDEDIAEQDWRLSADLTYEEWTLQEQLVVWGVKDFAQAIEAKLKEKNT